MCGPAIICPYPDHASACAENENVRAIAGAKQDKIAAEYYDDCECGANDTWQDHDHESSADALLRVWRALEMDDVPLERIALAREICRCIMRSAAESHAAQVMNRRD